MSKRIQKILNKMAKMKLGDQWGEYHQEVYNNASFRLKKHYILEQLIWSILTPKERFQERDALEATLTEKEWHYLIWTMCPMNVGRIKLDKRMKKHHPEFNVHKNNRS